MRREAGGRTGKTTEALTCMRRVYMNGNKNWCPLINCVCKKEECAFYSADDTGSHDGRLPCAINLIHSELKRIKESFGG